MSGEAQERGEDTAGGAMPVRGRIDRAGNLVEADPRLADLHRAAGGEPGGALVVPQLREVVRVARRLGTAIARPVAAATDDRDVTLAVRASPEGDEVHIEIDEWSEGPPRRLPLAEEATRHHDSLRGLADWSWETDDALRLIALDGAPALSERFIGGSLTALLRLFPDDQGALPILDALGGHRAFSRQRAQTIDEGVEYVLAAEPLFDGRGRFRGFRGAAEASAVETSAPPAGLGERVDHALRAALDRIVEGADAINTQSHGALRRDYADYAADISRAGRHLLGLIDDLADSGAVERGGVSVDISPLDIAGVARRAVALLAGAADARGITVESPSEAQQRIALGDERRVLQIIVNLLGNAIRYAPEHSAVRITAEEEDGVAALVVADEGRGIAQADHARIFDKFDRLGADEPGGSGLGLYIARRLARMMTGDIAVESAPGQGARFTLTLPRG